MTINRPKRPGDLAPFLEPGPSAGLDVIQGVVTAFNPANNTNTVELAGGRTEADLPVIGNPGLLGVNSVVMVLRNRTRYFILGPITAGACQGTYSPTITGTGGNPVINGTSFLTGKWWRTGRQVTAIIDLFIDSDADFGGSSWRITLPFSADTSFHTTGVLNAASDNIGNYKARSNTAAESSAGAVLLASATTTIFYSHAFNTSIGAANFTTNARLKAQVSYIAAG